MIGSQKADTSFATEVLWGQVRLVQRGLERCMGKVLKWYLSGSWNRWCMFLDSKVPTHDLQEPKVLKVYMRLAHSHLAVNQQTQQSRIRDSACSPGKSISGWMLELIVKNKAVR
jgi:hypothetical protein